MKSRAILTFLAITFLFMLWGCSDKKPTASNPGPADTTGTLTTAWNSDGYWETLVNAASTSHFAYYSFATKDTVPLSDQQAGNDPSWNIAFKRSTVILNGGVSGMGGNDGLDLEMMNNPDSINFLAMRDVGGMMDTGYVSDSYHLLIDEWYSYNFNTHLIAPSRDVYIMKDANNGYVKFQVIDIHGGTQNTMGTISIQYIYSGSSPSFMGAPDTLTFTDSTGDPIYVDFSARTVTHPSDPMNSMDWDLEFTNYDVHQNSTVFGHGMAGTYEVWQDQSDPTDFSETHMAPTEPQAYFPDQFGSIMTDWYNYDGNTHVLTSKNHVYIVRHDGHHYKMQIESYYNDINGSPISGWYSFRWLALD